MERQRLLHTYIPRVIVAKSLDATD